MMIARIVFLFGAIATNVAVLGVSRSEAQDAVSPGRLEAAKEFVALVSSRTVSEMTSVTSQQLWPEFEAAMRAKTDQVIDPGTLAELRRELERQQYSMFSEVLYDAPAIYARHFSEPELKQMTEFFSTPVGMKSLRLMPMISAQIQTIALPRLRARIGQIESVLDDKLRQRGYIR